MRNSNICYQTSKSFYFQPPFFSSVFSFWFDCLKVLFPPTPLTLYLFRMTKDYTRGKDKNQLINLKRGPIVNCPFTSRNSLCSRQFAQRMHLFRWLLLLNPPNSLLLSSSPLFSIFHSILPPRSSNSSGQEFPLEPILAHQNNGCFVL